VTTVRVLASIQDAPRAAWDALVGDGSPFLEWDWLAALEEAGTVTPDTGWLPQHLTLWEDDALIGACPLYVKGHSMGEFVFDQSWASAARRAGIDYYPKLLVGVPFTPVTGGRFLAAPGAHAAVAAALGAVLEDLCAQQGFSSAHVNFCQPDDAAALEARGWLRRTGYQYHWVNDGFRTFEDYLASLRSKRRNQARRERRELDAQGVVIEALVGECIPDDLFGVMFRCYETTIAQLAWGQLYLNQRFFRLVAERFRSRLCFIVARHDGRVVAGTFNVQKAGVLYGRYWGALEYVRHLHFNVCYYAAIEHCIANGLGRFEPGAGGEFKHLRGFDARPTTSMHHLRDPRFRKAVADYLVRERAAVQTEIDWLDERTALRRDREPEIE
jgi:predicted N-acyltransferase